MAPQTPANDSRIGSEIVINYRQRNTHTNTHTHTHDRPPHRPTMYGVTVNEYRTKKVVVR